MFVSAPVETLDPFKTVEFDAKRLGIRPGDRVVLRIPDRPEHVVCILALLKIGAYGEN